jgi:hypothetical protein
MFSATALGGVLPSLQASLMPGLSHSQGKRDSRSHYQKGDTAKDFGRVWKLPYAFVRYHDRSAGLEEIRPVGNYTTNGGDDYSENNDDPTEHFALQSLFIRTWYFVLGTLYSVTLVFALLRV